MNEHKVSRWRSQSVRSWWRPLSLPPPKRTEEEALRKQEQDATDKIILGNIQWNEWPGLQVSTFQDRGRGIVATTQFPRGVVVCHYDGTVISGKMAQEYIRHQEESGADTSYTLDFLRSRKHVIDALHGSGLGRLINHGRKHPNLKAVGRILGGNLYLLFETVRKILPGDELLYNYGQRSYTTKEGERIRPEWLNSCPCRICQEEERRKRKKKKKE